MMSHYIEQESDYLSSIVVVPCCHGSEPPVAAPDSLLLKELLDNIEGAFVGVAGGLCLQFDLDQVNWASDPQLGCSSCAPGEEYVRVRRL